MRREPYYSSEEAYVTEIRRWVLDWIRLYKRYAVALDEKGKLRQIKGSITFGLDLELSMEGQMTEKEIEAYEKDAEILRTGLSVFEKKAKESLHHGIGIPMEYLFQVFQMDQIERFCVFMSLAVEYDRTMGRMFSLLHDDYKEKYPTPDLLLKIYTAREEERYRLQKRLLSEDSSLVYFLKNPLEHTSVPIELSPRILRFLEQIESRDKDLDGIVQTVYPIRKNKEAAGMDEEERMQHTAEQLKRAGTVVGDSNVCFLYGPPGVGKKTLAEKAVFLMKRPVLHIDARNVYYERKQIDGLLIKIVREMMIRGAVPCVDHFEILQPEEAESADSRQQKEMAAEKMIRKLTGKSRTLFITSEKSWEGEWNWGTVSRTDWGIPFPTMAEQIQVWSRLLKNIPDAGTGPEELSVRFSLTPGQMISAIKEAEDKRMVHEQGMFQKDLYAACRRQLVMHLGSHVTQIRTQYQWKDLVLPDRQKESLQRACDQVEYNHQVYELWGFDQKIAYGKGVSMLFYGPPGTGKTMGAQVMANQLSMELYKVDLSSVMSKYIGETEKNLRKIFDEVKKSRSILFFDEADALFGKRTEVKDSHDKYANAETAYLLQKIEEYQGIVVLATNYMQNFDEAFKRRIKFIIEFPFPLPEYRLEMWKKVFPEQTPVEELDYEYLAEKFELSGSSIKNIAVAAAFLAAAQKETVGMKQILLALKEEMVKSGKSMPPESFGEYYSLIRDCC